MLTCLFFPALGADLNLLALVLLPFIFSPVPVKRKAKETTIKMGRNDAYRFFSSHFEVSNAFISA
jgi:hypothetical protein